MALPFALLHLAEPRGMLREYASTSPARGQLPALRQGLLRQATTFAGGGW